MYFFSYKISIWNFDCFYVSVQNFWVFCLKSRVLIADFMFLFDELTSGSFLSEHVWLSFPLWGHHISLLPCVPSNLVLDILIICEILQPTKVLQRILILSRPSPLLSSGSKFCLFFYRWCFQWQFSFQILYLLLWVYPWMCTFNLRPGFVPVHTQSQGFHFRRISPEPVWLTGNFGVFVAHAAFFYSTRPGVFFKQN